MTKRLTFTIKNDEILTFLDRRVQEINNLYGKNSEQITRTDYINYILEKEMIGNLDTHHKLLKNIMTKSDQTNIMAKEIIRILEQQNESIRNLIEEIEL